VSDFIVFALIERPQIWEAQNYPSKFNAPEHSFIKVGIRIQLLNKLYLG
jgi:hypothetical protein